ncbi:LysM peptidoglycan-binding domain-containing protein [Euzebya sp.]|uniref:LysM peptidoglycan-binding domain-containing protein n=1 Tax=Euzebya sp. TaxID=1971409 RepID=UPI003513368C
MSTLCTTAPALAPPTTRLRIRWARVALLVLAVAVLTWALAGLTATTSAADAPAADPVQVVVQPGDTLWDLARAHAPAGVATLEFVRQVEERNGVRAGRLLPGHVLVLPQG